MSALPILPCPECAAAVKAAIEALHVPVLRVPTIAAVVYVDAPRGTLEAIREWRSGTKGTGRREVMVRIVEVDGRWEETHMQEPDPAPPIPRPRLVLRRDGLNLLGAIKAWMGRA